LIRTGLRDPESAARAVEELLALSEPPTALFTSQNLLTIGGVRAPPERRPRAPDSR